MRAPYIISDAAILFDNIRSCSHSLCIAQASCILQTMLQLPRISPFLLGVLLSMHHRHELADG